LYLEKTIEKIISNECSIQVFGLGYVGFPLAIRLAKSGFKVLGIDTDFRKIDQLKNNLLFGTELSLKTEFLESAQNGNFVPSLEPKKSDLPRIGIICVPTPIPDGKTNSEVYVIAAVEKFLASAKRGDILILESSVRCGTTEQVIKIVKSRGYLVGKDFGVCFCPERIDPLNQKWKLENIPRVIFASDDLTYEIAKRVYQQVNNSNLFRVNSAKVAEVVKSFENAYRLVNISLVNELAILCDKLKINVNEVIDAASTKPFGFMSFQSGAGAGGHCIPKDPKFLLDLAKKNAIKFSSINSAIEINYEIPKYIVESIEKIHNELGLDKSVLVIGLSYKSNIEDMRDSPGFKISNEFAKRKFKTAAFDPHFKNDLLEKYLIENQIKKLNFKILSELDENFIKQYDSICLVQHHNKIKHKIDEIYKKSFVPLIYDCQNKLNFLPNSKTVLKGFGITETTHKYMLHKSISANNLGGN